MKISSILYNTAKGIGKLASVINDIETLSTGNPRKIANRVKRKAINKAMYKVECKVKKKL